MLSIFIVEHTACQATTTKINKFSQSDSRNHGFQHFQLWVQTRQKQPTTQQQQTHLGDADTIDFDSPATTHHSVIYHSRQYTQHDKTRTIVRKERSTTKVGRLGDAVSVARRSKDCVLWRTPSTGVKLLHTTRQHVSGSTDIKKHQETF